MINPVQQRRSPQPGRPQWQADASVLQLLQLLQLLQFLQFLQLPECLSHHMMELNYVWHQMGWDADKPQLIFVTVDPAHYTPIIVEAYVKAFDPTATKLVGDDQLAATASSFKASYEREEGKHQGRIR